MIREELLNKVSQTLREAGYEVALQCTPSCFDILARSGHILLVKVLTNVDSLYEEQAEDLKRIADVLDASPLLVGGTARGEMMKESTMYERHGIPAVSFDTFAETIVDKRLPFVYAKKGGFYAHINADFLKKLREKKDLSLNDLAREAGVSKATIQNYEKGEGAEVDNIFRLQEALGDLVLDPIDLFDFEEKPIEVQPRTVYEREIHAQLGDIGFKTTAVTKAAFSIVGKHKDDILLTGLRKESIEKKAQDIHGASMALEQHGMFVVNKAVQKSVSGVPVLERKELDKVVTSRELLKILKELEEEQ
ncbi:MAG: transcriptional regulator [archaeon]